MQPIFKSSFQVRFTFQELFCLKVLSANLFLEYKWINLACERCGDPKIPDPKLNSSIYTPKKIIYMKTTIINIQDIYSYFLPGQIQTLQDYITNQGYEDPVEEVIEDACKYALSEASEEENVNPFCVPSQLKVHVCHIAVDLLSMRLPGVELTADQIRNVNSSRRFLERLGQGKAKLLESSFKGIRYKSRPKKLSHKKLESL